MSDWLARAYWWFVRQVYTVHQVKGLEFIDVRADDRDSGDLRAVLTEALEQISRARGGFGELVTSHLRFVGALGLPSPRIAVGVRGYLTPFRGHERSSSQFLACRLIWAATSIRLHRDAQHSGRRVDRQAMSKACYEAEIRFVKQFDGWEQWVDYLKADEPTISR